MKLLKKLKEAFRKRRKLSEGEQMAQQLDSGEVIFDGPLYQFLNEALESDAGAFRQYDQAGRRISK